MNLQLEIIKVSKPEHKAGKGRGYNTIEITYKDITGGGKVGGKKLVDFGDYANVYNAAKDWEEGQVVNVETQKVDGYWTWVRVLDDSYSADEKQDTEQKKETAKPAAKQQWVPDEVRQRLIVRQTCLERAMQFFALGGGTPSKEEVAELGEYYMNWVFETDEAPKEAPAKRNRKPKADVEVE